MSAIETERALQEGARMWGAINDDPPELQDVVWLLLEEAAATEKTMRADRPSSKTGYWPETWWKEREIVQADNERNTEARESAQAGRERKEIYEIDPKLFPSADPQALRRYPTVVKWLRWIPAKNQKARRMELLFALAGGLSQRKAIDLPRFRSLGYTDRSGVSYFKSSALARIEHHIKRECPKLRVGVYAAA